MSLELIVLGVLGVVVIAYVLTGGADFGGGAWDLLAAGPTQSQQRRAVERALAPIWEANHIWMIFAVVIMFTAFPIAFAVVTTALHIPIVLALIGIVLRGAAFTFRAYGMEPDARRATWGRVFAWSSLVTPVFLGTVLGGVSSGHVRLENGYVVSGFLAGWTTPYAVLVGVFAAVLFALLAAVYLCVETEGEVREAFRRRALTSEVVAGVLAGLVAWRAYLDAPQLFEGLLGSSWSLWVQALTAAAAVTTVFALWARRFRVARVAVMVQVSLVVVGWQLAMNGHLVLPDLWLDDAGARDEVLRPFLWVVAVGTTVLAPALWYLFRVFKSRALDQASADGTH